MKSNWTSVAAILTVSLAVVPCIFAQQTATGTQLFGSFGGGPFDVLNLGNLNAHFDIPVVHKAGRGVPFSYDITYDSSVWSPVTSSGLTSWQPAPTWGWNSQTNGATGYIVNPTVTSKLMNCGHIIGYATTTWWVSPGFVDSLGTFHPMSGLNAIAPCGGVKSYGTGTATDGSGYTASLNGGIVTSRGGQIRHVPIGYASGSGTITDANGNQITTTTSSGTIFYDTLSATNAVLTISGTAPSPVKYTYTAPSGASASYAINYSSYNVKTNFGCSGISEYSQTGASLVSSVTLPDQSQYSFTYEATPGDSGYVTGRIATVTLPTGGIVTYNYTGYGSNGIECTDGSTAGFERQLSTGGTWTYSRSYNSSDSIWTTTITDPQGNQTAINFSENISTDTYGTAQVTSYAYYETQRQVNQLINGTQTLLATGTRCYNDNYVSCSTATVSSPITQTDIYSQLPNGSTRLSQVLYNSYGLVTDDKEYNYGVTLGSAPSSTYLVRETATSYASLGNGIVNKPSSLMVYDWTSGSAVTLASATYTYDQGTPTATSGTPQHIPITGSRGNLTTATTSTSSTASLSRTYTYYDTGNPYVATDVNAAQTTFSYGSGSCGNSFVTGESLPLGLSVSLTWNCTGGVMTSSTDPNTGLLTTTYNDPNYWQHPSNVTDQALNSTTISHPSQTASESVLLFNSSQSSVDVLTTLDAMGRPQLAQRRESPGSAEFDTIETDYDFMGRSIRTTLPYVATENQTNSSAPGTTTTYDAMGRVTQVADSGGGIVTKSYANNDVLRTVGPAPSGENTKRKQLEYDGLGRLTSVCELTTASGSGTCNQTSSQTGYWTKYAYNALGKIVTVTQNVQSANTQTRNFVFDMSGRLTSESNPETGTTTYTYDSASGCAAASKGDLIEKVDAVGNTTCYAYDPLHRVTSITYSGTYAPNTSNKYFVYDSATVNGAAMVNAKGGLAEAYTATCSTCTKITDIGYSYSAVGNVSDAYESTPHSGGYYHLTSTYWANGNLDVLNGLPGLPTLTYGVDGEGRGYSVTASSGQNPVASTLYNAADKPTSVGLGSGDSDSFSYDPNTGRITEYEFTINGQSLTGNLTWNQNQSLEKMSITDPFNAGNSQTCTYTFDDLRRISAANCGSIWAQTFSYDAFGNISKSGSVSFQPTYSASTNRMTTLPGFTPSYDANGNLLNDSAHSYTWDVNGRPVSVDSVNLTYDALGRMIEQNRSGSYTEIVYAPGGFKLALMSGQTLQKAFVPLPSGAKAVYTSSGLSYYRHPDWLGSSRLASTPSRTIYADVAYAPFGESYAASGNTDLSFTGQNQDTVSGLYDFPAREYSPTQGRWVSPDPLGIGAVKITNPRSWNRYAYTLNDPLSLIDPNGECSEPGGPNGLGAGQVGVCIDLFIAAPTIGDYGLFNGVGDDRGPVSDDPDATFRVQFSIVYDSNNNMVDVAVTTDPSVVSFMGGLFSMSLTGDTTGPISATANADGSFTVSIDTSSLNGFAGIPFAPDDAILLDMSLTIYPDGSVESDGGERSAFPSIEMWSYQPGQDPYNVLYIPESGNPGDLGSLNQDVPPTTNPSVTTTPDSSDNGTQDGGVQDGGGGGGGDCDCDYDDTDSVLVQPGFFVRPSVVLSQLRERQISTGENGA